MLTRREQRMLSLTYYVLFGAAIFMIFASAAYGTLTQTFTGSLAFIGVGLTFLVLREMQDQDA